MNKIDRKAVSSLQAIIVYALPILGITSSYLMNLHNGIPPNQIIISYGISKNFKVGS